MVLLYASDRMLIFNEKEKRSTADIGSVSFSRREGTFCADTGDLLSSIYKLVAIVCST